MPKQIIIAEQHRIASVFAEEQIQELIVATGSHQVSDIYLGVVENILPSIDAAFVNIGDSERNGFIHVSDLGPLRLRRTSGSITELLAPQQKVLVQVMKEPTGNKGPRLTGNISLPGRYLVLMPYGKGVNLSRRINQEEERSRLRALGILIKPSGMGLLVRTEADGVSEDAIIEDLELLQAQWEAIQQQASSTRAPALLDRDTDFIQKVLRDVYSSDVNRIVVDSESGLNRVKKYLANWNGNRLPQGILIDQHREQGSVLEYFRVNAAIREALKPRVDLPSGGYIIIERTEALTVIDVNSGSFTRSATARETVLWTNCEAAVEIARQLRLRNIAGVIIVDFIDMDSRRDQLQVLEHFNKALRSDKSRPQIAQLTELGLVELTRKRQGQNIYELFGRPCQTCGGLGHLAHLPGDPEDSPGAMVERQAPRSFAASSAFASSRSTGGFETMSNLQELDLMNHPSYQEQGNRKRRRRSRLGATLSTSTPKVVRKSAEESEPARRERPSRDALAEKASAAGRRRSRRESPKIRQELPPEIVSIQMSDQEQHVYAFLGISPLVKFEGTVNNPKTAIVKITAPGKQAEAEVPELINGAGEGSTSPGKRSPQIISTRSAKAMDPTGNEPVADPAKPEESDVSLEKTSDRSKTEPPRLANSGAPRTRNRKSSQSKVVSSSAEGDEPAPSSKAPRRRRRRSSASSSAQQLSLETSN
ncbi:Rne/Rng family ribonuclease [Lyngbya confervoides]|uniref:Rne/Rng family ribonuclease n=1 Tax=Lyngbya confervoides BDU141951 TaxID=1574623 RepID=A0ABD4T8H3_9CYAN|nr:Rne/Rng family ribonuclease [Lyngbya confervoides]MCM1984739.1 Rne/Rng family ribonuclease [Lyngbya confervoides BDU141951]